VSTKPGTVQPRVSSSSPARFSLRRQLTRPHQLSMPGRSSLDPPWFISQPRRPTPQVDLPCDIAHPHGQVDPTGNGRGEALELRGRTNPRLTTLQDAPAGWARSLCLSIPGANSSHHRVWFLLWILAVAVNGSFYGHRDWLQERPSAIGVRSHMASASVNRRRPPGDAERKCVWLG